MHAIYLGLFLGLCLGGSSFGLDFHVSPSGNDLTGDGSAANPWKTLAHAALVTPNFNTIRLAAGTYRETVSSWVKANVSVIGPGPSLAIVENAFVSGFDFMMRLDTALDGLPDGILLNGNQTVSGFHITGVDHANRTRQSGIRIRGRHNVTVENMKFSNMGNGAIEIRAMDSVNQATGPTDYLQGTIVRNCVFENTAKDLYANVLIGGVNGADLSNLTITEGRGVGIKAWVGGWLKNLRIRGCTINMLPPDRNRSATAGDDWPTIELTQVSDGSEISDNFLNHWISLSTSLAGGGEWNLRIRNNHFVYEAGTLQSIQIGNHGTPKLEVSDNFFENIGPNYAVANWPFFGEIVTVSVHHNVFKGNGVNSQAVLFQPNNAFPGFTHTNGNITGIRVFNNTFVDVSDAILMQPLNGHSAQDVIVQNNIFADYASFQEPFSVVSFNTAGGTILAANVSHNLFHNIPANLSVAGTTATNSLFVDPSFAGVGQRPRPYYELTSASPAINAGVSFPAFPVADGQTDLGAYEGVRGIIAADSDGDGQSDEAELTAGTSATNPNDFLRIVDVQKSGDQLTLTWTSVPGKTYAVEATGSNFGAWAEQTRGQATASQMTQTIALPAGSPGGLARVRVFK